MRYLLVILILALCGYSQTDGVWDLFDLGFYLTLCVGLYLALTDRRLG